MLEVYGDGGRRGVRYLTLNEQISGEVTVIKGLNTCQLQWAYNGVVLPVGVHDGNCHYSVTDSDCLCTVNLASFGLPNITRNGCCYTERYEAHVITRLVQLDARLRKAKQAYLMAYVASRLMAMYWRRHDHSKMNRIYTVSAFGSSDRCSPWPSAIRNAKETGGDRCRTPYGGLVDGFVPFLPDTKLGGLQVPYYYYLNHMTSSNYVSSLTLSPLLCLLKAAEPLHRTQKKEGIAHLCIL
ncbi:uncharacterized protein EV420DRAFT_1751487 [Desarmillaria tabescens]|uniref:Uncharacterized protein n=1 Tax=Armillaria tabescens TaxID=1929756 RepID=A0AA39JPF7_ARMTA|nr:uncharacterized protein EV420DRAFT_1751487 [Desarmillaria tabescens]KAK0446037.1 hypothetical protein EV420DRAFT_1751487 [Desarmillaria tabescens]